MKFVNTILYSTACKWYRAIYGNTDAQKRFILAILIFIQFGYDKADKRVITMELTFKIILYICHNMSGTTLTNICLQMGNDRGPATIYDIGTVGHFFIYFLFLAVPVPVLDK